ncbi:MAG: type II toxin-antitoxin system RelE/ParE family toxin [Oscillospiraceae bacterium]|nr:type II toxin-antitoxin system RelE/ParE family toxin [Oscillospiraceae bacterium]
MKREFVMTEWFDQSWSGLKLTDEHLLELQSELMNNPQSGTVMRGTGGFRKMRFALPGRGKSSSVRIVYIDISKFETVYLMLAYPKSEKDSLSQSECNELKKISENIKNNLSKRKGKVIKHG